MRLVRLIQAFPFLYRLSLVHLIVLGPARAQVLAHFQRGPSGYEAAQPAGQQQLRFEDLRLWPRPHRLPRAPEQSGRHDRLCGHTMVPRSGGTPTKVTS